MVKIPDPETWFKASEVLELLEGRHDGDSHEEEHDEDSSEGVVVAKVIAMLVLGLSTLFMAMLPMWLSKRFHWNAKGAAAGEKSQITLTLLRALGGGALLATTFLHMIPELREGVDFLEENGTLPETSFHFPELLVCCGFFVMYAVEEIVHAYLHWRENKNAACQEDDTATVHRSLSVRRCSSASHASQGCPDGAGGTRRSSAAAVAAVAVAASIGHRVSHATVTSEAGSEVTKENNLAGDHLAERQDECDRVHNSHIVPDYGSVLSIKGGRTVSDSVHVHLHEHEHGHGHSHAHEHNHAHGHSHGHGHSHSHVPPPVQGGVAAALRGLLVVLALSVHKLFEGLAVGLQTTAGHVYYLMGALAVHEVVLAFCVGLELVAARMRSRITFMYVLVLAIVSPLGIGVGLALSNDAGESAEQNITNCVLRGLSAGTLLYVIFFEVLERDRNSRSNMGLFQFCAVLIGFGVMFGLLSISGHEHNHGDGGHNHSGHDHSDGLMPSHASHKHAH